ncbi:MAG: cation-translocating P-type ATPase, partial [Candidatus Hodarchaeota archaeon]
PRIKKSIWKIYLAPIFNFLIIILLVAGVIVFFLGSPGSTVITFIVVFLNSITVIIQQFRAQKALESLRKIGALKAEVLRDGVQFEIPTRELAPGDIILLEQGDKIPADGRIITDTNLTIDEAPLTGESEPVEKHSEVLRNGDLPIQKQLNMVFMGTYINTGRGKALVTRTGINTEIGKISNQLNEMGSIEEIPLTKKLNRIGYILGSIVILILITLIIYKFTLLGLQGLLYGDYVSEALISSILRSMNIMPINLPILTTLVLITGVLKMAESGVIIKNLSAIESLGRVSVICSDKTGTITRNEMEVDKFFINNKEYCVTGSGYEADGEILDNGTVVNLKDNKTFQKFIESSVLNNNARLIYEDVKVKHKDFKEIAVRRALGSPTEAALLTLAEKAGYVLYDLTKAYEKVREFSFSSDVKRMSTICRLNDDKEINYVFSKGAPEKILEISNNIEINGTVEVLSTDKKNELLEKIQAKAKQGYRTLAVAYKTLKDKIEETRETVEKELTFLSFLSIMDPPRNYVKESVEECESGGIKIKMITGDHPNTAQTIASQMRIFKPNDLVIEGSEVASIPDNEFSRVSVFARVSPSDKEVIVKKYQDANKIVAMTGDGINDALALKLANTGIAMGITGTDVAKETADLVISDDDFTSIVKGVKIGRGLFAKIRVIVYFFICLNIMEALIFFSYEFIPPGIFQLFSSEWQHIYIFGIVHSLPSLALVVDKAPKDVMLEPPRDSEEILNRNIWGLLLIHAFLMGLGLVLALQLTLANLIPLNSYNINLSYPGSIELAQKARTMFITTLFIVETNFIWSIRRPNKSLFKSIKEEFSWKLFLICFFTLALHVLHIIFSAPINYFVNDVLNFQINFMFLSPSDWLICILLSLPGIVGIEVVKFVARRKNIRF